MLLYKMLYFDLDICVDFILAMFFICFFFFLLLFNNLLNSTTAFQHVQCSLGFLILCSDIFFNERAMSSLER